MEWLRSIDPILAIQNMSTPFLDLAMRGLSFLGSEFFYFAALLFLYWSGKRSLAVRLTSVVLLSLYSNFLLKELFQIPRPSGMHLRILETPEDFSFPSGHAQSSASFWFFLAFSYPKVFNFILAGTLVFLVSLSRLYLGVHYLGDVLFGAALGFGFALSFAKLLPAFPKKISLSWVLSSLGLLSVLLFLFAPSPLAHKTSGALSGALFGHVLACRTQPQKRPFLPKEYLAGAGGVALLYLGGKVVPFEGSFWLWVRYFALTFCATFVFPVLLHSQSHDSRCHTQPLP